MRLQTTLLVLGALVFLQLTNGSHRSHYHRSPQRYYDSRYNDTRYIRRHQQGYDGYGSNNRQRDQQRYNRYGKNNYQADERRYKGYDSSYYHNDVRWYDRYARRNASVHWGQRTGRDRMLCQTRVHHSDYDIRQYMNSKSGTTNMRYSFIGKTIVDVDVPFADQRIECNITYIEVLNMGTRGGYVCITRGGLGHSWVTLHFESSINCDMDYLVRVYGCYLPYPC